MADFVTGITPITPAYPVRPAQPANKDREPGGRKKKRPGLDSPANAEDEPGHDFEQDFDDKPTIDEHA